MHTSFTSAFHLAPAFRPTFAPIFARAKSIMLAQAKSLGAKLPWKPGALPPLAARGSLPARAPVSIAPAVPRAHVGTPLSPRQEAMPPPPAGNTPAAILGRFRFAAIADQPAIAEEFVASILRLLGPDTELALLKSERDDYERGVLARDYIAHRTDPHRILRDLITDFSGETNAAMRAGLFVNIQYSALRGGVRTSATLSS